jgi:hypothetical protein
MMALSITAKPGLTFSFRDIRISLLKRPICDPQVSMAGSRATRGTRTREKRGGNYKPMEIKQGSKDGQ